MPMHFISAIVLSILVLVGKISKKNPIIMLDQKNITKICDAFMLNPKKFLNFATANKVELLVCI